MLKLIRNFVRDERGEDLIEYGLLAAFVAAIGVIVAYTLGLDDAIQGAFQDAIDNLNQRHVVDPASPPSCTLRSGWPYRSSCWWPWRPGRTCSRGRFRTC